MGKNSEFPAVDQLQFQQLLAENQRQKALLEAIFEAVPSGIAVLAGEELRFVYVNPAYRFLCPDPVIDPIGKAYAQIWPVKSEYDNRDRFRNLIQTGQPFQILGIKHTFPDQTQRIFTLQARRIEWEGQPACLVLMWDTTEQTQAYEQSERDRNQLQAMLAALPVGVVIHDREGGIYQSNPMFEQIWGAVPESIRTVNDYAVFQGWWAESGKPVQPEEWASAQAVQKGCAVYGQEMRIRRFDGQQRYVLNSGVPIRNTEGEVVGSVVAILDITERREAQAALQLEKATLQSILNAAKESIWLFDPDGIIRMANETALARLNRRPEEVIGKNYDQFMKPEIAQARKLRLHQVVETGQPLEFEDERAGIHFLHSFYPVSDPKGRITGVVSFSRDVTEGKQAEKALLESEERFRVIAEATPVGIAVVSHPDSLFLFVNKAYEKAFGYAPGELLGRQVIDVYWDQEDRQRFLDKMKHQGNVAEYEVRLKRRDGSMFWGMASARQIIYEGQPALLGVFMDITERVQAEQDLREQEQKYRELFRNTQAAIYEVDFQTGKFVTVNDAMCQLTGYSREELLGMEANALLDERGRQLFQERTRRWLAGEKPDEAVDYAVKCKDGTYRYGLLQVTFKEDEEGRPVGASVIAHDITERKQFEKQRIHIELQRRLLEQREQERLKIAQDLHDGPLQNLIAGSLMIQRLEQDCSDPEIAEQYSALQSTLKETITELRSYAQELRPPTLFKFGLEMAIRTHIDSFREKYPNISVQINAQQEGGLLPPEIRLTLLRIYQEAMNNIARHCPNARVTICLLKSKSEASLEISDNGPGFVLPQDWLALARSGHLGLVGMRERAEAVGGEFAVLSTPGAGTTIKVTIPLA